MKKKTLTRVNREPEAWNIGKTRIRKALETAKTWADNVQKNHKIKLLENDWFYSKTREPPKACQTRKTKYKERKVWSK